MNVWIVGVGILCSVQLSNQAAHSHTHGQGVSHHSYHRSLLLSVIHFYLYFPSTPIFYHPYFCFLQLSPPLPPFSNLDFFPFFNSYFLRSASPGFFFSFLIFSFYSFLSFFLNYTFLEYSFLYFLLYFLS